MTLYEATLRYADERIAWGTGGKWQRMIDRRANWMIDGLSSSSALFGHPATRTTKLGRNASSLKNCTLESLTTLP